jgi:N-acyl-D-aspartate/D-glutamate deacylase
MKQLVTQAMQDERFGRFSSLIVPADTDVTTRELIGLVSAVKPFGGIYSTHVRGAGKPIFGAIREAIAIGEKAGAPVDIIHLKIADKELWGQMNRVCDLIEQARKRGLAISANQYPYVAGQNFLVAFIPPWAMEGGMDALLKRLESRELRARMEKDIYRGVPGWFDHYQAVAGWQSIIVASIRSAKNKQFEGKSVAEIARITGKKPADVIFDLDLEDRAMVPAVFSSDERGRRAICHENAVGLGRLRWRGGTPGRNFGRGSRIRAGMVRSRGF